jgi:RNA polymerase sigma factor (sigma-70 family)
MRSNLDASESATLEIDKKYYFGKQCFKNAHYRFSKLAFRYGMRFLNDPFTIESVVQEAFLKLWNYRDSIASEEHARRFLFMHVKWECYAYFRSPVSRFYRRFTHLDAISNYDSVLGLCATDDTEMDEITTERLNAVNQVLPFLSAGKEKNLIKMYYTDGLSHKQIAAAYGNSVSAVSLNLRKAVNKLQTMILQPKKMIEGISEPAKKVIDRDQCIWLYNVEGLDKKQSQIYRLRIESKYSFEHIAITLNIPQSLAQKEYVKAWKIVSLLKKEKNAEPRARNSKTVGSANLPVTFRMA